MADQFPYPDAVQNLIDQLAHLPGIGKRSAERLAFHLLGSSRDEAMSLAMAIRDAKTLIRACRQCFNAAQEELCPICTNPARDAGLLCVVELPRDILAFEKACGYNGLYHVLQGHLKPAENLGPEALRIRELLARVQPPEEGPAVREVILALNPTAEGDMTASHIESELTALGVRVTRLARGLASGTELESTSPSSLKYAFEGRLCHG